MGVKRTSKIQRLKNKEGWLDKKGYRNRVLKRFGKQPIPIKREPFGVIRAIRDDRKKKEMEEDFEDQFRTHE